MTQLLLLRERNARPSRHDLVDDLTDLVDDMSYLDTTMRIVNTFNVFRFMWLKH